MTSKEALEKLINDINEQGQVITTNPNLTITFNVNLEMFMTTIENALKDLERLEALEKENKKLNFENQALRNGIDLDLNAKLLSENKKLKHESNSEYLRARKLFLENEKLKKALDIIKKIVSIPLEDDFAKVKIDKETKEETLYYALSIKYLIDEQEYDLLKEVLG